MYLCKFVKDVLFFTIFPGAVPVTDREQTFIKCRANELAAQIHLSNEDLKELLPHLILKTKPMMDQKPSHSFKSPLHLDFL